MPTITNWPIDKDALRKALSFSSDQGDDADLALYAAAATDAVDRETGRHLDPVRHCIVGGTEEAPTYTLPVIFILAARATAKLWWQQDFNGPQRKPGNQADAAAGTPMGADLPSRVKGWLKNYPAAPGIS